MVRMPRSKRVVRSGRSGAMRDVVYQIVLEAAGSSLRRKNQIGAKRQKFLLRKSPFLDLSILVHVSSDISGTMKPSIPNHNRSERRNRLGVNSRLSLISGPSRTSDPHCFNITKVERMLFVNIPAGSFMMRCSAGDRECYAEEKPIHRVSITRPFPANRFVDVLLYALSDCSAHAVGTGNPMTSLF